MRLVKVRIRAGDISKGENQLMYPARYNPIEVDRFGGGVPRLNNASICMEGDIGRGGEEEYMIIVLPDALAEEYADDPDMMIIDSTTADADMENWRIKNDVPDEIIDNDIVQAIRAKQEIGLPQTPEQIQKDQDALDSSKSDRGIRKARKNAKDVVPEIDDDLSALPANKKAMQRAPK